MAMRRTSYYSGKPLFSFGGVKFIYNKFIYCQLGIKLGFTIGYRCFNYGLVIPHPGTIVVGNDNRCGRYCVLHSSTCITGEKGGKRIGDALYLSSGARINKRITLGNNVQISSNSVVNKSFVGDNLLLVGMPAFIKKTDIPIWYGGVWGERVKMIEKRYKNDFKINS